MTKVTIRTTFFGGSGFVIYDGEGIPQHAKVTSDDPSDITADQTTQDQSLAVGGQIPAGDAGTTGKVTIEVLDEDGNVLSPASDNIFTAAEGKNTFTGIVTYQLPG